MKINVFKNFVGVLIVVGILIGCGGESKKVDLNEICYAYDSYATAQLLLEFERAGREIEQLAYDSYKLGMLPTGETRQPPETTDIPFEFTKPDDGMFLYSLSPNNNRFIAQAAIDIGEFSQGSFIQIAYMGVNKFEVCSNNAIIARKTFTCFSDELELDIIPCVSQ